MTTTFFRDRGPSLALVILIMFAISLGQAGISYTMAFGALRALLPRDRSGVATSLVILRFGLVALMAVLWALRRKHALFQLIIIANALFTIALLIQTSSLISALFGGASEAINALLLDVALMATSNILIFSVWYWVIDPPGIEDVSRADEPWDFLFPQRGSPLPHYDRWVPRYADYVFVAFTTSFAFSPTDTLPLTRRAKMLMLLQAAPPGQASHKPDRRIHGRRTVFRRQDLHVGEQEGQLLRSDRGGGLGRSGHRKAQKRIGRRHARRGSSAL